MNRTQVLRDLSCILRKYDKSIGELTEDSLMNELVIEDLSKVQVIMEVERVFNVEFELMDLNRIRTVEDIVMFIEKYNS